ncbi:hypothetical protein BP6252_09000 [Coleophoma cylindrospora]|uniref:Fe2OG dioxygenase domain-containing protein n=1 Tax=Coleophoma cylindrospora TaxID=1849047 RepID=A0A3D8R195_9HELO|nr:hypothetical protein BP6252_09000 [Coleophoma cylindrospora]
MEHIAPTHEHLRLTSSTQSIHLVHHLLSQEECNELIATQTDLTAYETRYARRNRSIFPDPKLSERIWSRIQPFFKDEICMDDDGEEWKVQGLNEVWRLVRYDEGGIFGPHTDGTRLADLNTQSFMTINIYLNTVPPSQGGSTRFLQSVVPSSAVLPASQILTSIQPNRGTALIFAHDVPHDGDIVQNGGTKYLLRTDMMYRRCQEFDFERLVERKGLESGREKGEQALKIANALEDAGTRDLAIVWYKKAFRLCPELDV